MPTTIEAGLVAFLKADSGVGALVGSQVYPDQTPQGVTGARVVIVVAKDTPDQTLERGATVDATAELTVTCYGGKWGPGYTAARSLADAVLAANGGGSKAFRGFFAGAWGGVLVQCCRADNGLDHSEPSRVAGGRNEEWVEIAATVTYQKQT